MKAFTDLEQSKKLAEILPIESADMTWEQVTKDLAEDFTWEPTIGLNEAIKGNLFSYRNGYILPCWSLAALLKVIPKCIGDYNIFTMDINDIDTCIWYDRIGYGVNTELPDITKEEPIDACVAIIIKLYELKML